MDTNLISVIIGSGATILAAILTVFGKNITTLWKRKELGYPEIKGYWKATWYLDDSEVVYIEDTIKINKIRGMNIYAEGIDTVNGNYPLNGKFSKNLILNFIYESGKKYISLSGVIILKMDPMGTECKGKWYGYTKEDKLMGGNVAWKRL